MKTVLKASLLFVLTFGTYSVGVAYSIYWPGSGAVAHAVAQGGEELCIIQTYKNIAEPFQVSLFARKPGQGWVWTYLGHQDPSWDRCEIRVDGDAVRVRRQGLIKTLSLSKITDSTEGKDAEKGSADWTIDSLVEHHNRLFSQKF